MKTIPTLAVISTERSGTNFLGSCLRQLHGDAVLHEVLAENAVYGMSRYDSVAGMMSQMIGHKITGDHDVEFSRMMHETPVKLISFLNHAAAKAGKKFFSYKLFPDHLDIARTILALQKPAVTPLFLVRRRLDCYISYQKALQSDVWQDVDTTNQRPTIDLADFDDWAKSRDHWYKRLHQRCHETGLKPMVMRYEDDVDVAASDLIERMRYILQALGVTTAAKPNAEASVSFTKQDQNTDPFAKIANGEEIRAQLIEQDRLDYACGWALETQNAPHPTNASTSANGSPAPEAKEEWGVAPIPYFHWMVLDQPDLVTMTSVGSTHLSLPEFFLETPELAGDQPGLHFLTPTWKIFPDSLGELGRLLSRFHSKFPKHRVYMQAADIAEFDMLEQANIPAILCNASTMQDEDAFDIAPDGFANLPQSDSLYIARFSPFKRHHLCQKLEKPLYIYEEITAAGLELSLTEQRALNPTSVFVNHELNGGTYGLLDPADMCRVARNAKTALCLSEVEGHMRTSIQMLLCGLPVVSTPSQGGRDRYYTDDTALIVDPDADAVAQGVATLKSRNLSPASVRRNALEMLNEDRTRFVRDANKLASDLFGPTTPTITFDPFKGKRFRPRPQRDFINILRARNGLAPLT